MPTFRDAIEIFRAKADAGEIVNRKTNVAGEFKASRFGPLLSHVTAAVREAAKALHAGRELGEAALLEVELEPLWMVLTHASKVAAKDRADPESEVSNVRLFVSTVTGVDIERRRPVTETRVPAAWRPLYDAVVAAGERAAGEPGALEEATVRAYKRGVLKCAELMLAHGIGRPEDLPNDFDRIHEMGVAIDWSRKDIAYILSAYRAAADLAGLTHLPRAHELVDKKGMGIRGLPDFPARLAAAGYTGDPRTVTTVEMVTCLAPSLGAALVKTTEEGRKKGRSLDWVDGRETAANALVGTLLRGGVPGFSEDQLRDLTWLDLWLDRVEVEVPSDAVRDDQMDKYAPQGGTGTVATTTRSLMHLIIDAAAARSYANSHLTLQKAEHERDAVPVYTDKVKQNLEAAWMITLEFFRKEMRIRNPDLWDRAVREYEELQKHIDEYNEPRLLKGRKKKDELSVSWPQMVCMGLPHLAKHCHELRGQITERLFRARNLDSRDSRSLVLEYDTTLRRYITTAFVLDDGLRLAQYANAMVGEQIVPSFVRDRVGDPVAIAGIETRWSSLDHEFVAPKVKVKGGALNERTRSLTMAFFDPTLLWDYWTQARPRALVSAGLLATVEDYDIENDRWPLIITGRPKAQQVVEYHIAMAKYQEDCAALAAGTQSVRPELPPWRGNLSEDSVSNLYGQTMHEVAVTLLKRDLPAYNDKALTEGHRGLFSIHITRTQIACYFGGMRGDWARAETLTNDAEATLRMHYNKLQKSFESKSRRDDWDNPRWFDDVIDRALKSSPGDDWPTFWRKFDPMRPRECLKRMVEVAPKLREPRGRKIAVRASR